MRRHTWLFAPLFLLVSSVAAAQSFTELDAASHIRAGQALEELRAQRQDLLQGAQGVLVRARVTGSQAEAADIRPGDAIAAYAGRPVNDVASLMQSIEELAHAGGNVEVVVIRDGVRRSVSLRPGKMGVALDNVASLQTGAASGRTRTESDGSVRPHLQVQTGHALNYVQSVVVSPDGTRAVSTGAGAVKLWDLVSGKEIRAMNSESGGDTFAAISPNGRYAFTGGSDKNLYLWDLTTGQAAYYIAGPAEVVGPAFSSLAFSPDGRQFLTGGAAGVVLWDFATGARIRYMTPPPPDKREPAQAVAFSPDGRQALSASSRVSQGLVAGYKGDLHLWDVASGQKIRSFEAHAGLIKSVAFSPDGKTAISSGQDKAVKLWDLAAGAELRAMRGHPQVMHGVALSPDGRYAASVGGGIVLWDVQTGQELRRFRPSRDPYDYKFDFTAQAVAFTPDGRSVLTGGNGGMYLWDIATGKEVLAMLGIGSTVNAVAFSPDGKFLSSSGISSTSIWNLASGRPEHAFDESKTQGATTTAFSLDGRQILTGYYDKVLTLRDVQTGKPVRTFKGHSGAINSASLSQDGRQVLTSGGYTNSMWQGVPGSQFDQEIRLWDVASGTAVRTWKEDQIPVQDAVLSPDGSRALSSTTAGIKVWDAATGTLVRSIPVTNASALAVSRNGRYALVGSLPSSLLLLDLETGEQLRRFDGHKQAIKSIAFSPDDKLALAGGYDGMVKLWDVATGREVRSMTGHDGSVVSVAFSPDGRLVASGSHDASTRVWDVASGRQLVQLIRFMDGEWLSITPEGYFSASSPKAAANLNLRYGKDILGIDQFFDVFYRPDIVEAALAGKNTASLVTLTIDEAIKHPPPLVEKIDTPMAGNASTVQIRYRIKSNGGGIGEVRVFHNGKLVQSDGLIRKAPDSLLGKKADQLNDEVLASQMRAIAASAAKDASLKNGLTISPPKPDLVETTVDIEPVPGDNEVAIVAFNAQNSVQSVARTASFSSSLAPAAPRLHILAIGIDDYKDKSASLKFAVKDANDLAARWKAQAGSVYGSDKVFVETVSNAQAGRDGILAKINEVAARIKPTDHFVLFIASHGVLLGDQYYMVTSDYDGALQPSKLISANEIVGFSKRIKALSQLYILDTCHAGGLGGLVSGLYDARISVLAKKMGLHVFASASSTEEALDGFEGNGLFTHTLLAGLNNNRQADLDADKQVSLMELGKYSKGQTQDIARRLKHKQDPLIINFGMDNPVYKLP